MCHLLTKACCMTHFPFHSKCSILSLCLYIKHALSSLPVKELQVSEAISRQLPQPLCTNNLQAQFNYVSLCCYTEAKHSQTTPALLTSSCKRNRFEVEQSKLGRPPKSLESATNCTGFGLLRKKQPKQLHNGSRLGGNKACFVSNKHTSFQSNKEGDVL